MAGFWMGEETQERMDLGLTRALVLLSFLAHLTLALLAGIRRRRDSGLRRSLVWLAYHVTEIATPIALGKVFLDNTTADSEQQLLVAYREQQMFAFWAPFLLLHLGRPDNITSYALENKGLTPTQKVVLVLEIGGAIYGSYKQRFMRGDGALHAAFFIMLFFGSYKNVERAVALHRASFANIRRSNEKKGVRRFKQEKWDNDDALLDAHGILGVVENVGFKPNKHDNDGFMLDAHGFLGVTMGAFTGYQVHRGMLRDYLTVKYFSGSKNFGMVVEMEASLMYDMLYTKASVVHTWAGYIIRVLSPLATSTALYLFHRKEGQAMVSADQTVTYILLAGTLVLDVTWLLRALGSTWTYAFLVKNWQDEQEDSKGRRRWLKKAGRQAVRQSWYWLHGIIVSLDPFQLSLLGSGVGQYNLFHECCDTYHLSRLEKMISFYFGLGKKKIDVNDDLFEFIIMDLELQLGLDRMHPTREVEDYVRCSGFCFEKTLIALHIATDIFFMWMQTSLPETERRSSPNYKKQIQWLSDYMMFLLAQRQHMVLQPGDEGIHYQRACLALKGIWREEGTSRCQSTRELTKILLDMAVTRGSNGYASLLSDRNDYLALGADWALNLLREVDPAITDEWDKKHVQPGQPVRRVKDFIPVFTDQAQANIKRYRDSGDQWELLDYILKLILESWVRLLMFASVQCSRESHAKQLSCGGELLTIVWLMKEHGKLVSKRE